MARKGEGEVARHLSSSYGKKWRGGGYSGKGGGKREGGGYIVARGGEGKGDWGVPVNHEHWDNPETRARLEGVYQWQGKEGKREVARYL